MTRGPLGRCLGALGLLALAASCGGPAEIERIVFVTLDTTRADRLGCYGFAQASTPHLDALAAEGVLFEHAVAQVPTTLPSHASMFTGLYPQDHGVRYNILYRLGAGAVTLAERLRQAGYATAAFPAAHVVSRRFGLDQGFDLYWEPPPPPTYGELADPASDRGTTRQADAIVDRALGWLDEHPGEKTFAWVHLYDPHFPYEPPFPYSDRFRDRLYDGEIAFADAQLGRLFERLREDPAWGRTLVIVAGDHGEGLYEHGERFHSWLLYETTQRVPLIVRAPGFGAARVERPVALVDLMPTVLELAGLEIPGGLRGESLVPALGGAPPEPRDLYFETLAGAVSFGWLELRGLRSGQWKLIEAEEHPELYDLAADPRELNNLAALERERLEELRAALARESDPLEAAGGEAEPAHGPVLDADTAAFLASLGYVGGSGAGTTAPGAAHPKDLLDLEAELVRAHVTVGQGRWAELEELCRYVLGRDPTNRWALFTASVSMLKLSRPREAQDYAAELLRLYPQDEVSYSALAIAYREEDRLAEARQVLRRGLDELPDSEQLEYQWLLAGYEAEDPEVCASRLGQAIETHPRSFALLLLRARCEAAAGDAVAALGSVEAAVALGFRDVRRLSEVAEFAAVITRPEFESLAARAEAGASAPAGPQG